MLKTYIFNCLIQKGIRSKYEGGSIIPNSNKAKATMINMMIGLMNSLIISKRKLSKLVSINIIQYNLRRKVKLVTLKYIQKMNLARSRNCCLY